MSPEAHKRIIEFCKDNGSCYVDSDMKRAIFNASERAYHAGMNDPDANKELLDLSILLDDYTIHTRNCYDNRKSLSECLCGLNNIREKLKAARAK